MHRVYKNEAPAHSRIVELFVPEDLVPHGIGNNGGGHREHVVPCVYLLEQSKIRFEAGHTMQQVVQFLKRCLVIVNITEEEQRNLDGSKARGGRGLKNRMPNNWDPESGCIYQRLHDAEIKFDPPEGEHVCLCEQYC
jgi:hypothetical protein